MCAADHIGPIHSQLVGTSSILRGLAAAEAEKLAAEVEAVRVDTAIAALPATILCPQSRVVTAPLTDRAPYGSISASAGAASYLNNMRCAWILAPATSGGGGGVGGPLNLLFEAFDTESERDVVTVYECADPACKERGALLAGPLSGANRPPPVTAESGAMLVLFESDGTVVSAGFFAIYYHPCPLAVPPSPVPQGAGAAAELLADGGAVGWAFAPTCPTLTQPVEALTIEVCHFRVYCVCFSAATLSSSFGVFCRLSFLS